jgi:hypothetical protein
MIVGSAVAARDGRPAAAMTQAARTRRNIVWGSEVEIKGAISALNNLELLRIVLR